MKPTLFFFAFLLLLACKNENAKEASNEENKNEDNRTVEKNREPAFYIAFRDDKDGPVYLTDSDEDIDRLIVDLRPLDVDVALLERDYWRDERCRKMSARKCAQGNCLIGDCKQVVVGKWNVCRCE